MPSVSSDLRYLQGAAENLETYLLSDALSWPIGVEAPPGEAQLAPLSVEGVLLARQRLAARQECLSAAQQADLRRHTLRLDELRSRWRSAYERKAQRCFVARLRLWQNYLDDYRQQPDAHTDRFAYEVRHRVMLHLLCLETTLIPHDQLEALASLDRLLRGLLQPADFIWEADLQSGFPAENYWYLYALLPQTL